MYRYFTNSYHAGKFPVTIFSCFLKISPTLFIASLEKVYSSMILSAFSHSNLVHLGLNMYVLWSFSSAAIDKLLGLEQFVGFYLSAGKLSIETDFLSLGLKFS